MLSPYTGAQLWLLWLQTSVVHRWASWLTEDWQPIQSVVWTMNGLDPDLGDVADVS